MLCLRETFCLGPPTTIFSARNAKMHALALFIAGDTTEHFSKYAAPMVYSKSEGSMTGKKSPNSDEQYCSICSRREARSGKLGESRSVGSNQRGASSIGYGSTCNSSPVQASIQSRPPADRIGVPSKVQIFPRWRPAIWSCRANAGANISALRSLTGGRALIASLAAGVAGVAELFKSEKDAGALGSFPSCNGDVPYFDEVLSTGCRNLKKVQGKSWLKHQLHLGCAESHAIYRARMMSAWERKQMKDWFTLLYLPGMASIARMDWTSSPHAKPW